MKTILLTLFIALSSVSYSQEALVFNSAISKDRLNLETAVVFKQFITGVGTSVTNEPTAYFILGYDVLNKLQISSHLGYYKDDNKKDSSFYYANKIMLEIEPKSGLMVGVTVDNRGNGFLNVGFKLN